MSDTADRSAKIATVNHGAPDAGTALDTWTQAQTQVLSSFDIDTEPGRQNYLACISGTDAEFQAMDGKPLHVVGWLIHLVERDNPSTGEVTQGRRLVLLCKDGTRVGGGSKSTIDGWGHVCRMYRSMRPWPELIVKLKREKGAKPGTHYVRIESITLPQGKGK